MTPAEIMMSAIVDRLEAFDIAGLPASILTALTEAGYAIVPAGADDALAEAVYVVRNMTGESAWAKSHGHVDPAEVDEDLRCWADHWQFMHKSVRDIAARQDAEIAAPDDYAHISQSVGPIDTKEGE